jgi:hypothetical protein
MINNLIQISDVTRIGFIYVPVTWVRPDFLKTYLGVAGGQFSRLPSHTLIQRSL